MSALQPIVERLIYPLWERWSGARDLALLGEMKARDRWSPTELRDLQRRRLRDVLMHAYRTVPFYERRFDDAGLDPERVEDVEQLSALPVLTKAEIHAHVDSLISTRYARSRLIRDSTGGSTGDPLRFYLTERKRSFVRAATLRENAWLGCRVGDRILRLWGSPRDRPRGLKARVGSEWVHRTRVVDAFELDDAQIRCFLDELRRYQPVLVIAYAKAALFAAQYARRQGLGPHHRPKAVVITAEGLTAEQRTVVREVFGCPVVNRYASREMGHVASGCGATDRLHTVDDGCVVEVVPLPGDAGPDRGRLVVTDLVNDAMPLIRYDTGDVGVVARGPCPCGRPYGLLEDVEGRVIDLLRRKDGGYVHGLSLFRLFREDDAVKSFQVVQESLDRVRVKVVPFDPARPPHLERIREGICAVLGDRVQVETEVCVSIPQPASGKHRFTISKVTAAES
jgi:phenylacetate-CoA ligase